MFVPGSVGDVEYPEVEGTSSCCCCVGSEERGGWGAKKTGLQLAGSKTNFNRRDTLAGYTTPRVRVIESFRFNCRPELFIIIRAKRVSNCYLVHQKKKKVRVCVCSTNLGFSGERIMYQIRMYHTL